MVTRASTANAAVVVVDARHGVVELTKRHTFITSLLNIPYIIMCVNKMGLVSHLE
jgi:sulfate adenylyltransferase subunit 1